MIPGTKMILGDKEYEIPPLTFEQWKVLEPQLKLVINAPILASADGAREACTEIVGAAMRRNYPDMTDDDITAVLDFGNYIAVLRAMIGTPTLRSSSKTP